MPGQAKRTPEAEAAAAELIRQLEEPESPLTPEDQAWVTRNMNVGSCPDPDTCFPNGIDPAWSAITCVHGSFEFGQR